METKNYFTKSNWRAKLFQFAGIIAISFAVLISCQKKNDSNGIYNNLPYNPALGGFGACAGCNFAQMQMAQPISRGTSFSIQWNMFGDQAVMQQLQYTYGSYATVKSYVGPVVLSGVMNVTSPLVFGSGYGYYGYGCQLPVGQYQISNYSQPGQMSSGGFLSNMQFQAIGNGVQIIFSLSDASIGDLQGSGQITHINGLLVPATAVINGQQMACSDPGMYVTY